MYYYPISDLAIIPLSNGKVLFKSDNIALRINGKSTSFLVEEIFPLLDGIHHIKEVATKTKIVEEELEKSLDNFVNHGILRKSETQKKRNELTTASPVFENFLDSLGLSAEEAFKYLKEKRITIVGLDGIGYFLIKMLIKYGVNSFNIADCLKLESHDQHIYDFNTNHYIGQKRQEVVRKHLIQEYPDLDIKLITDLTKDKLREFAKDSDIIVGSYDKAYAASNYWINEVAFELDKPSLYAEIKGQKCFIGPLVIPERTACFMCYKMRNISCVQDYEEAMSYEEYLNAQKTSNLSKRGFFPSNINLTASMAANEIIKFLLSLDLASIKSKILEFDVFNLNYTKHNILFKSDCPVCRKKKSWIRKHYDVKNLIEQNHVEGDLSMYENTLVSYHSGIVTFYDLFKKDISEPNVPFIYRADLANHNFIVDLEAGNSTCSGKGLTLEQAKISALGEAVERYSGAIYKSEEIKYVPFKDIKTLKLHPKELVLYKDHQYRDLEFSKFKEDNAIGWVDAYSLLQQEKIAVPAISIFMDYKIGSKAEYLFPITSNGLGAGATLLQAIISASLEVIERDAFIITWHQRLMCERYDPLTLPMKDVVDYCKMYKRRGVELSLFKLPTDFPCHVFLAIAHQIEGDGPAIVVGLGADFNPHKAAKGALIEVGQVRPGLRKRMRFEETQDRLAQLIKNPQEVKELEDHDLLYASPDTTHHFDFLLDLEPKQYDLGEVILSEKEQITQLIAHVKSIGSDLIYYNLTPPEMEKLHLFTARAVIPQLQPIHFGASKIRLGGKRLYELPYTLQLKNNKADSYNDISFQPHPLA